MNCDTEEKEKKKTNLCILSSLYRCFCCCCPPFIIKRPQPVNAYVRPTLTSSSQDPLICRFAASYYSEIVRCSAVKIMPQFAVKLCTKKLFFLA